MLKKKSYHRF